MPLEFDPETLAFRSSLVVNDPSLVTFRAPLFVLVKVVKVLFVVNHSLNRAFHSAIADYNVKEEGLSRSLGVNIIEVQD
jgi:hypothetical protein